MLRSLTMRLTRFLIFFSFEMCILRVILFSPLYLCVKNAKTTTTTTTTINQINDVDYVGTHFKQCKTSHQKVNNRLLTVMLVEDSLRFVIWLTIITEETFRVFSPQIDMYCGLLVYFVFHKHIRDLLHLFEHCATTPRD